MKRSLKMADRIVMGYWDCEFCGKKHVLGTLRECPGCGRPRGNVKFYMDSNNKVYLTPEQSKDKGNGEDWYCDFCNTLNSNEDYLCKSCGASRQHDSKTYYKNQLFYTMRTKAHDFSRAR